MYTYFNYVVYLNKIVIRTENSVYAAKKNRQFELKYTDILYFNIMQYQHTFENIKD